MQFFSTRKPISTWSKINKFNGDQLIENGIIAPAGHACIEGAKANGSWAILDDVEELIIPIDLEKAFKKHGGSKNFFLNLSRSVRKMMLQWIVFAKRPGTRQKRIEEIAESAAQGKKPKPF